LSSLGDADLALLRRKTLDLYSAVTVLMLVGIAILVVYSIRLGPLTSPGAEQSFGLAISLMALMGAMIFHLVDRTYRVWPLGRRVRPSAPPVLSTTDWVRMLKVLVLALAVGAIAYIVVELIV
jgi:hypothetical protein